MTTQCPHCNSENVKRRASGAVIDDYGCKDCDRSFEIFSPAAKRVAIVGVLTMITAGLEGGVIGGFVASLFGAGDDSA